MKNSLLVLGTIMLCALVSSKVSPSNPQKEAAKNEICRIDLTGFKKAMQERREADSLSQSSGVYIQKVLVLMNGDSSYWMPHSFTNEFISSRNHISESSIGTWFLSLDIGEGPEKIAFGEERKDSDTLFYYNEPYPLGEPVRFPIAFVTPQGEVFSTGNYLISENYLADKVPAFFDAAVKRHNELKKLNK